MSNDSNVSSSLEHSDSSDSDEDLDAPEYSKIFSKRSADEAFQAEEPKYSSPQKVNRLDSLLSDHLKEAAERSRLEKVREELLQDIHNDSREELQPHSQSLASEHEDHLQQLDVKSSEQLAHPGIKLFNVEKLCCLYSERTSLFAYGFTSSGSAIDKILANTAADSLSTLLLSKAIVTCMLHISDLRSVLIWLLNILAVHSSPVTVHSCYNNLIGTLHQFKVSSLGKSSGPHISWCPHPLALMRIFVNLGARAEDLLGKEHKYSQDEIRKFLTVENDENVECKETPKGQLQKENVQMVYKVMALALQTKPSMAKEDLTQIFFMLAKVELDNHVNRSISLEAQECFSAILQCYTEEDWSSELPYLCKRLCEVSDHHHNQVHLADLLPGTTRGSFLQVRFSYLCLRALLLPDEEIPEDSEILHLKLANIPNLCNNSERSVLSPLAKALRSLLEEDLYKMISAIKLLDMCVGNDLYRSDQPSQSLEYLITQTNLVIRKIKDNISAMDLYKIKDSLSSLKVKWCLSLKDHHSKQRSIFSWLSQTDRDAMTQEVLKDHQSLIDDEME